MRVISHDDLTAYPSLSDKNLQPAGTWLVLELANGLITDVVGATATVTTKMRSIALEVAARALRNPNGYSSERIDDYGYNLPAETRQAGVYLTPSEVSALQAMSAPVASAYTVDLGTPWPW